MGIEQMREQQQAAYVSSGAAAKKTAEVQQKKVDSEWSESVHRAAVATYQVEATPLSERTREIIVEREVQVEKSRSGGAAVRAKAAMRAGDTETQKRAEAEIKAVNVPTVAEASATARVELLDQGFTEEQLDTPYGELGGSAKTGYLPPNVVGGGRWVDPVTPAPVSVSGSLPIGRNKTLVEGLNVKVDANIKKLLLLAFAAKTVGALKK